MKNYKKPELAKLNIMSLNDIATFPTAFEQKITEIDLGALSGQWLSE